MLHLQHCSARAKLRTVSNRNPPECWLAASIHSVHLSNWDSRRLQWRAFVVFATLDVQHSAYGRVPKSHELLIYCLQFFPALWKPEVHQKNLIWVLFKCWDFGFPPKACSARRFTRFSSYLTTDSCWTSCSFICTHQTTVFGQLMRLKNDLGSLWAYSNITWTRFPALECWCSTCLACNCPEFLFCWLLVKSAQSHADIKQPSRILWNFEIRKHPLWMRSDHTSLLNCPLTGSGSNNKKDAKKKNGVQMVY